MPKSAYYATLNMQSLNLMKAILKFQHKTHKHFTQVIKLSVINLTANKLKVMFAECQIIEQKCTPTTDNTDLGKACQGKVSPDIDISS